MVMQQGQRASALTAGPIENKGLPFFYDGNFSLMCVILFFFLPLFLAKSGVGLAFEPYICCTKFIYLSAHSGTV